MRPRREEHPAAHVAVCLVDAVGQCADEHAADRGGFLQHLEGDLQEDRELTGGEVPGVE
jgi:hypothetical protein